MGDWMAKLFSEAWLKELAKLWNNDEKMTKNLEGAEFFAVIGYGYLEEKHPRGYLYVDQGKVIEVGEYDGRELSWDLRADPDRWKGWIDNGFGLQKLGTAVVVGELKFLKGDYRQMIKNVRLSVPFLRHFELMREIRTEL